MERNAFLFGFSRSRLLIGAGFLGLIALVAVMGLLFTFLPSFRQRTLDTLITWLTPQRLLVVAVSAAAVTLSVFILYWATGMETTIDLNTFEVIFTRLRWMTTWLAVVSAQFLALLVVSNPHHFKRREFYDLPLIFSTVLVFLFADSSLFHWIINEYEIQIFVSIPFWTWSFVNRKTVDWLVIAVLLLISLGVVTWVLRNPKRYHINMILLVVFGYVFQIGYGFAAGEGFESIRQKSIKASHVRYLEYAVDNLRFEDVLFDYETAFGWGDYLGTKPPGVLAFYLVNQRLSGLFQPPANYATRFERLSKFITYLFPLLTFLILVVTVRFSRKYLPEAYQFYPALLMVFLPNMILMPLEIDQVLFIMLFMLPVFMIYRALQNYSIAWAFATGVMVYVALYFSFSLLPLGLLIVFWVLLDFWQHRRERRLIDLVKVGVAMALGFFLMVALGYFLLNYDMLFRYRVSVAKHKMYKLWEPGLGQILAAIRMNNLEIATWVGFPIAILWLLRYYNAVRAYIKKQVSRLDVLTMAFLLMFIFLNILGQTRGEVARLWLFMMPLIALFSTQEILRHFRHHRALVIYLVVLQFITILMTYRCADFW